MFSDNYHVPADKVYCITFTPRSGSTWLGDILTRSGLLGDPKEYFNQEAARFAITHSACTNLQGYYNYLKTVHQTKCVFGYEVAFQHIAKLIDEGYGDIFEDVDNWFLLRRRDYVAQAVSLYRASISGVFHSYQRNGPVPKAPYDGDRIARFALGALASEYNLRQFFETRAITPRELWYEELVAQSPGDILRIFTGPLGLGPEGVQEQETVEIQTSFEKLADDHSESLIQRFKQENPEFISFWDEGRGHRTIPEFMIAHPSYVKGARLIAESSD